jgi:hypothetical protein
MVLKAISRLCPFTNGDELGWWGGGGWVWVVGERIEDGPVPRILLEGRRRPWRSVASQSAHERPPSASPVSWLLYGGGGGGGGNL